MEKRELSSKVIDHLGLVAGMYDELSIGKQIDSVIKQDFDNREVSIGTLCKALVLNGLGFTERRLYLVSSFFEGKPVETLLGEGVQASHLNDSVLGRALDEIHAYGTTELYGALVENIYKTLGLKGRYAHMDSTSFHLDGEYNSTNPPDTDSQVIHLTRGYSRDHRSDLNQAVLNMIAENEGGIPLHMEALSGNCSDKTVFQETVKDHISRLQNATGFEYLVMDSAGYTSEMLSLHSDKINWISRVPESLKSCKEAVCSEAELQVLDDKHQYRTFKMTYAGIEQRWLLIKSEEAFKREVKTLEKNWLKKEAVEVKAWKALCKEVFLCSSDAERAIQKFKKKCRYIDLKETTVTPIPKYRSKGRPKKGKQPDYFHYQIGGSTCHSISKYEAKKKTKGKFIIATNELDTQKLSDEELLKAYKGQAKVERGFRFLKDPQFIARNFFVKKPERVEALLFIMTLSLTVYAALEYRLRQQLDKNEQQIPNQLGKPTKKPTMRWIFALFEGIHFLYGVENQSICLNFSQIHSQVIQLLGEHYRKYYLIV